jgi:hypothetical protein
MAVDECRCKEGERRMVYIADLIKKMLDSNAQEPEFIGKLRRQRTEQEDDYYAMGILDALEWAEMAKYSDLKYVVTEYLQREISPEGLVGKLQADRERLSKMTEFLNTLQGAAQEEWVKGWEGALKEFWHKIEPRLSFEK